MNPVVIVLGILVIILLYYLYVTYYRTQTIYTKLDLNKTPSTTIKLASLVKVNSSKYAYGIWFFVNSNPSAAVNLMSYSGGNNILSITSAGRLTTEISRTSTEIMKTVPIQRWTHVIISIDDKLLDIYIDGKLYKSNIINDNPRPTADLMIGDGTVRDIYLSKIKRWDTAMDPTTAWKTYLEGNGMTPSLLNYNLEMIMSENSKVTSKYSLF